MFVSSFQFSVIFLAFFIQIWHFLRQLTAEIFVYLGVLLSKNLAFLEENRVQKVAWQHHVAPI